MSVWLAMPAADLEELSARVSGVFTANNRIPIKSSASSQVRLLEFDLRFLQQGPYDLFPVVLKMQAVCSSV